jgi:hypothetical protein
MLIIIDIRSHEENFDQYLSWLSIWKTAEAIKTKVKWLL